MSRLGILLCLGLTISTYSTDASTLFLRPGILAVLLPGTHDNTPLQTHFPACFFEEGVHPPSDAVMKRSRRDLPKATGFVVCPPPLGFEKKGLKLLVRATFFRFARKFNSDSCIAAPYMQVRTKRRLRCPDQPTPDLTLTLTLTPTPTQPIGGLEVYSRGRQGQY